MRKCLQIQRDRATCFEEIHGHLVLTWRNVDRGYGGVKSGIGLQSVMMLGFGEPRVVENRA